MSDQAHLVSYKYIRSAVTNLVRIVSRLLMECMCLNMYLPVQSNVLWAQLRWAMGLQPCSLSYGPERSPEFLGAL